MRYSTSSKRHGAVLVMKRRNPRRRRASALLLVLFLMAITVPLLCLMLETHATHVRCVHNSQELAAALYVAQAGVHDAMSELLVDPAWRTGFTSKEFPAGLGHTYTVTLADGDPGEITITSTGTVAQGFSKTVTATVRGF